MNRSIKTYLGRFIFLLQVLDETNDFFGTDRWQKICIKAQKYVSFTQEQKIDPNDEVASRTSHHQDISAESLAEWALEKFSLPTLARRQTISRIIRSGPREKWSDGRISKRMRDKDSTNDQLEQLLYDLILDHANHRRNLSGDLICSQAQGLQNSLSESATGIPQQTLRFSEGWVANFKRCFALKKYRSRGESGDVVKDKKDRETPSLQKFLANHD